MLAWQPHSNMHQEPVSVSSPRRALACSLHGPLSSEVTGLPVILCDLETAPPHLVSMQDPKAPLPREQVPQLAVVRDNHKLQVPK